MSANLSIKEDCLFINIKGIHKILSFKSELKIPLEQIASVDRCSTHDEGWLKEIRSPGIHIPGFITAGTYYHEGEKTFWDVKNLDKSIILKLIDNSFSKIVVEVDDPEAAIKEIQSALLS